MFDGIAQNPRFFGIGAHTPTFAAGAIVRNALGYHGARQPVLATKSRYFC